MTARIIVFPLDVDAIAARAEAAPAGNWEAFPDTLWIPFSASTDEDHDGEYWRSGRVLAVREFGWHTGSEDPGPELWEFLAAARDDVLTLAAEVRRLRAALGSICQEGSRVMSQTAQTPESAESAVTVEEALDVLWWQRHYLTGDEIKWVRAVLDCASAVRLGHRYMPWDFDPAFYASHDTAMCEQSDTADSEQDT